MDTVSEICKQCRQPLEEWEAGFCEGCGLMTNNERRFLELGLSGWASVRGSTLIGKSNGRGVRSVLRSLASRGLIERRTGMASAFLYGSYGMKTPYDEIRTTDDGRKALGETVVTDRTSKN